MFATGQPARQPMRDAVARGGVGVGRVEVDLAGAARGEDGRPGPQRLHPALADVQHVGPVAAVVREPELAAGDEVDRDVPLEDLDVGVALDLLDQGALHGVARGVGRVDDAPVAVAPLPVQVQLLRAARLAGERHALVHQPVDRRPAALDHEADRVVVAEPAAGHVRVADVVVHGIGAVQHGGDAALGVGGGAFEELVLGDEGHLAGTGEAEGGGESGEAAPDDKDVVGAQEGFLEAGGDPCPAGTICPAGSLLAIVAEMRTTR